MNVKKKYKSTISLLMFIAPFTIIFSIFMLYPLSKGIVLSFTDWNGISPEMKFVGLKNYIEVFAKDSRFINSLKVTGLYTVCNVVFSNALGLLLAVFIERSGKIKNVLRTLFFIPYILSLVVVGFTWKLMYTKVAADLYQIMGVGLFNVDFLGDSGIALLSVIMMSIWQGIGYYMLIYIAGLQSLDTAVLEAADIDGASEWRKFFRIKIPLLMPSLTICIFTSIADSLKVFDAVFVLTSGGPGYATETMALNIYNEAFGSANLYGYGMAKAVILAVIILIVSVIQLGYFKKKEVEV